MKNLLNAKKLPLLIAALGGAGFVMRKALYAVAVDEKNLLLMNHPLEIALTAFTLAVVVLIIAAVRKLDGSALYEDNFRADLPAAIGHILAACGILMTRMTAAPTMPGYLGLLWQLLGFAAPVCLILAGLARTRGKQPHFLLHLIPSMFLMFHIVNHYQVWSSNPQFQDYAFDLLGAMALLFFIFYSAAFDAGVGRRRMHLFMGLVGAYLCMTALAETTCPWLYLGGAALGLTDLCSLEPKPKPEPDPQKEA